MTPTEILIDSIKDRLNVYNEYWHNKEEILREYRQGILVGLVIALQSIQDNDYIYVLEEDTNHDCMHFGYYDNDDNWHTIAGE